MRLEKPLPRILVTIVTALFLALNVHASDDPVVTAAKEHLVGMYFSSLAEDHEKQLAISGLANVEIQEMLDEIAMKFADCLVDALQNAQNDEVSHVLELVAKGVSESDITDYLGSIESTNGGDPLGAFDYELRACMRIVEVSYGLVGY